MVSVESLFSSWEVFRRGKRKKLDIQAFERFLEDHLFALHEDLMALHYKHQSYQHFYVFEPKERYISKATVRDRLVHQMLYSHLVDIYDSSFIAHSYACRVGKGTHKAVNALERMLRKCSRNHTRDCFIVKLDIHRFFDSIHHNILRSLLQKRIKDPKTLWLIDVIIDSFSVHRHLHGETGLPLGNVTSQLFANVYLHELDTFIKHTIRHRYYLRYCDDFILLSSDRDELSTLISPIRKFLKEALCLELHPVKILLTSLHRGIDFLGYIQFFNHRLLRTKTKKRMLRRLQIKEAKFSLGALDTAHMNQCLQSYLGILSHANQRTLSLALQNAYGGLSPLS